MDLINCLRGSLAFLFIISSVTVSNAQTWEVYDQNFKLKSRIEYDQISILGEAVRISSANNGLKLLSKEYKPFLDLKGETVYQYLEPWIIVNGPQGMGVFHEYGEEIFAPEFDYIQTFYTRILAQKGNEYWLYDRMSRSIIPIGVFDNALLAKNGQIIAKNSQGYTLPLSRTPNRIYQDIREVNENFLIAHESTGFGLINREGKYVLEPIIDQMVHLEDDYFYAFDGNQYMLIKAREERVDIKYNSYHRISLEDNMMLEYIHGKLRRVMKNDGILLDLAGMVNVSQVGEKHYNIALRDKKTGLLGPNGWEVSPALELEKILPGNESLFGAIKEGKFGFVDRSGKMVVQNRFDTVSKFSEGLAAIKTNGHWGFVDRMDQLVIPAQYDRVTDFYSGIAIVQLNGKGNLIDKSGRLLLEKGYSRISLATDNYFITEEGNQFGLISPLGQEIVEPKFDELRREAWNRILVRKGDKYGVIDEKGEYLLPIYYKSILFDHANNQILAEDEYVHIPEETLEEKTGKKKRGV